MKSAKKIRVFSTTDAGLHHISFSHPHRLPTWDEVKYVRDGYGDPNKFYVMVLPPKEFYVNFHQFCFHLWEVKSEYETEIWKGM